MAIQRLKLPTYADPSPRMPVTARYVGPALAAVRRHSGYRFVVETDRHGETSAWIERAKPRFE